MLPYADNLSEAMIDLLQVESVPDIHRPYNQGPERTKEGEQDQSQPTKDFQPTSTNPKLPPLRRAALHFLTQLFHASTADAYNSGHHGHTFSGSLKRMKTTLAYIASTDKDHVVRVMAREAMEGMDQLAEAIIGL
jgi:hypothetical protein